MPSIKKRIIHYCQYVLGVGHYFRSLEIAAALSDCEVIMVSGGPEVEAVLPAHVRQVLLPGLKMEHAFGPLVPTEPGRRIGRVREERAERLKRLFKEEPPDLFLVELFPFGRNLFRFELLPVLQKIHQGAYGPVKVASSVRDIIVPKYNQKQAGRRALGLLNYYFQALLVHADPKVQTLAETFHRADQIEIPVIHTGYVTPRPAPGAGRRKRAQLGLGPDERLIVASIGGGGFGGELIEAVLAAFARLSEPTLRLEIFTGPLMAEADFSRLSAAAQDSPKIRVRRFAPDFIDWLAATDLSVSLGGAGTVLNTLAAGARALIYPLQNQEQPRRAEKLAAVGAVGLLSEADLDPARLADRILAELDPRARPPALPIDLDGAKTSAEVLSRWLETGELGPL
ncbi:MAG: glycosyl transferase [Deltaproteobacteria bacterium]|nr:glycosyl transferase [Deltaproteobacteria bacterium]